MALSREEYEKLQSLSELQRHILKEAVAGAIQRHPMQFAAGDFIIVKGGAIGGDSDPGRAREGVEALEDLMRQQLVGVQYDLTTLGRRFAEAALEDDKGKP